MKVRVYVLDVSVPRWLRYALIAGIPAVILATTALVRADVKNVFAAGDPLSSAKLNENFSALNARIQVVETGRVAADIGGMPYSVGATKVIGATATRYNGAEIDGYRGAKKKCVNQFTATAHMCTTEEVARSAQAGVAFPADVAWYMTATRVGRDANPNGVVNDCFGWTVAGTAPGNAYGAATNPGNAVSFTLLTCNEQASILCCD